MTGLMVIDDLSVRISKPVITSVTADTSGKTIVWFSMPSKLYTVQFASALGHADNLDIAHHRPCWRPLALKHVFGLGRSRRQHRLLSCHPGVNAPQGGESSPLLSRVWSAYAEVMI